MRAWDLRFPNFPIPLDKDNLLGTEELCRDLYLEKHLKGFDRWLFAGCYRGWPTYFGCSYQGASLSGNRAFIQSHSFVCSLHAAVSQARVPQSSAVAQEAGPSG